MSRYAIDIYDRVDELVEEMKGDWKKLFESDAMGTYLRSYAQNLFAGVYESLRSHGAQIPQNLVDTEMNRLRIERIFDPNNECDTAECVSTDKQFVICINGCGAFQNAVDSVTEKFELTIGLLIHEIGHRLFTDFRTLHSQQIQMTNYGSWVPNTPRNIGINEGIILSDNLAKNENYRKTFAKLLGELTNYTEDGYEENEMREHYKGRPTDYIDAKNSIMFEVSASLTDVANGPEPSHLRMVLGQWLMYAVFHTLKIGEKDESEFEPEVIDMIYAGLDTIDEIVETRDPILRASLNNQLAVLISPFVNEEIKKNEQQQQGGNDQGGGNNGGSCSSNNAAQNAIQSAANDANGGFSTENVNDSGNTTNSITNTNNASNSGLDPRIPKPNSQNRGATADPCSNSNHEAAEHDLNEILTNNAISQAHAEAEAERTKAMQKEANEFDYDEYSCQRPEITRAAEVSDSNKANYDKAQGKASQIARRLSKILLNQLKCEETESLMGWQYSGSKFNAKQYCRDNLKGFMQRRLPVNKLRCRVYVLADESGSVSGELNNAEIATSVVLEEFCRTLDVPLTIQGYTTGEEGTLILSYVEEEKIDNQDKYRITGMDSRVGTPTVAAMVYAVGRLKKNPDNERKLLFVITDGGAGDDDSDGTKTRRIIEMAAKSNIQVIACGIGPDKSAVMSEFGEENYLGIDNLEEMPAKLVDIIRRRIMRR